MTPNNKNKRIYFVHNYIIHTRAQENEKVVYGNNEIEIKASLNVINNIAIFIITQ